MASNYLNISPFGSVAWKDPVDTAANLPVSNNALGDARAATDTGVIYVWDGSSWNSPAGSGTVTSVGLADSTNTFNITNTPVTGAGSLTLASFKNQTQNKFLASPNGSTGAPAFRAIVAADVPTLNQNTTGTAALASDVSTIVHKRYIDFVSGNDSTGTGTIVKPWKTLQHAYDSISPTINEPYTFYLSGGNNDVDSAITAKPNVSLISDYPIQVTPNFTISGGITNDTFTASNITFLGNFTWSRNDTTDIVVNMNNVQIGGTFTVKQAGAGNVLFVGNRVAATSTTEFQAGANGAILLLNCTFFGGTLTFDDAPNSAYYEFLAGYLGEPITINGGAYVYFSGVQADVPFGYTLTGVTTGNGTPVIQSDSGSIPPTISGAYTLAMISYSQYESYTPISAGKWANPQPTTVKEALDRIAAVVGAVTPIP